MNCLAVADEKDLLPVNQEARDKIISLENALLDLPEEAQLAPLSGAEHHMAHGVYMRVWRGKTGETVIGRIHLFSVNNILLEGKVRVFSEETGQVDIEAPYYWTSKPEQKRAVFVLEACTWITVHPTQQTEYTDELLDEFTVETYDNLAERKQLALEEITQCQ